MLLISEAGAQVTDLAGRSPVPFDLSLDAEQDLPVLAAAPGLHARLLDSVRAAMV